MKKKVSVLLLSIILAGAACALPGMTAAAAEDGVVTASAAVNQISGSHTNGEIVNGSWTFDPASKTLTLTGTELVILDPANAPWKNYGNTAQMPV